MRPFVESDAERIVLAVEGERFNGVLTFFFPTSQRSLIQNIDFVNCDLVRIVDMSDVPGDEGET